MSQTFNLQQKLAAIYHTTAKPDNQLSFAGVHHVVGLDADPVPHPKGRFIYFALDNPKNEGVVLRGANVCGWEEKDPVQIRAKAIDVATRMMGDATSASAEVDAVIAAGGMLLPKSLGESVEAAFDAQARVYPPNDIHDQLGPAIPAKNCYEKGRTHNDADLVTLNLNIFDDDANVVDATTVDLTVSQLSDIVDHASQLILAWRSGIPLENILSELDEVLSVSAVISAPADGEQSVPSAP